jgi:RNA polymerase sigma-70 factor (ECF subfamily)
MLAPTALQPPETDLSLLRQFVDTGDSEVFAAIVQRYSGVVYSASWRILNDDARAQEVSQETFFRLLRQPRLVTQSLGGWLHRTATHLAIDCRRSETSRRQRERNYGVQRAAVAFPEQTSWEEISPHVDAALEELPEPARTLLTRHFLQGTPQAELAEEMNLSAATISRKINMAVVELRKRLKQKGIYVGLLGLIEFCRSETARAAPPQLMTELAKMGMVGPIDLAPPPAPGPPAIRPPVFQVRHSAADSTLRFIGTWVGVAGLIAWFSIGVFCWLDHSGPFTPAHPAQLEEKIIQPTGSTPIHPSR